MASPISIDNLPQAPRPRRPDWLKVGMPGGEGYTRVMDLVKGHRLHTVCQSARCPNVGECWGRGTATFMILGDVCTRHCRFCSVTSGRPQGYDLDEAERVSDAIAHLKLKHVVVTSVTRDDLKDHGSEVYRRMIVLVRQKSPGTTVELLIPDFRGHREPLERVLSARPDVLGHNVETVPRLYRRVRPGTQYPRSLGVLRASKEIEPSVRTKTGIMVGLGEEPEEVRQVMRDAREHGVDIFTVGQYLQPTKDHLPVERFVHPDEFRMYKEYGLRELGYRHVESGPLVRSSYHAEEAVAAASPP
ncbi:MAG TPA: lipoyl synthase [Candidatus Saccharimonadales bacterium]|nr:lipoyl synthase [Candidatus Saccharimonadales bacterium]